MKMKIAGLMVCVMLAGAVLLAEQENVNMKNELTYVAVPMKMFKMLTEKPKKPEAPKFYIYQNGKLEECTTNYNNEINKCPGNRMHKRRSGKFDQRFHKGRGDTVFLTVEQLDNLKKQKMEQILQARKKAEENLPLANSKMVDAKVNGKDVKVAVMNRMMQPGFNNMMPGCPMGQQHMNPMMQPGFNNMMPGYSMGSQHMNPME